MDLSKLTRYESFNAGIEEWDTGEYVRYDDVVAQLAAAPVAAHEPAAPCPTKFSTYQDWVDAKKAFEAQSARQADDAKDGARYRWLCEKFGQTHFPAALERLLSGREGGMYIADGKASIDAAIDASMQAV